MPSSGLLWLAATAAAYLLGSIPFGLLLTRAAGLGDIRQVGSGNIGATNVLRAGGKGLAAATLLLDGAKGALAVWLARQIGPDAAALAAVAAVIGHNYPVWLGFKGGKGMATALGALLVLAWPVWVLAGATWLLVAAVFRWSSLATMASIAAAPVYALWLADRERAAAALAIAVLVILRHHGNIRRLVTGTEPKIGQRA